ncbi:hypothetical protein GCM10009745_40980 [Kribbella yunnanensis]|uniref:Carrier domain-containing protein n=1 Tax=Kribbella yunnanensis TaxID=190194 RepID=A0ABN2HPV6_9ACTN
MEDDKPSAYRCSQQQIRSSRLRESGRLPALQSVSCVAAALDPARLRQAWQQVHAAYPVLSARIGRTADGGAPMQVVDRDEIRAAAFELAADVLDTDPSRLNGQLDALTQAQGALIGGDLSRLLLAIDAAQRSWLVLSVAPECCDATSVGILLAQLLDSYASGAGPEGEEIDYLRYAQWQYDAMREAEAPEFARYWQTQWREGADPLSFLPLIDGPHPVTAPEIAVDVAIPADLVASLQSAAARTETSPDQVVLAGTACLLSRLSGMDRLCLGWSFNGRTLPELSRTVGPLAQMLPFGVHVAADDTTVGLIRRIGADLEVATDLQDFVDWREPGTGQQTLPFSIEWLDAEAPASSGSAGLSLRGGDAAYTVKLTVQERGNALRARWSYIPGRIDAVFVRHLAEQWLDLLPRFLEGDELPAELTVSSEAEHRLLRTFAGDPALPPYGAPTILDLIDGQVLSGPDAIAVRDEESCLTYAAFDRRTRGLAAAMRSHAEQGLVGIDARFGIDAVVLMIAALRAGLAYVPVDLQQPQQRLASLIAEQTELVVFGLRPDPGAAAGRIRHVLLEPAQPMASLPEIVPDAPAYVILTSGSTGVPKGVNVSHRSLAASTQARLTYYHDQVDRYLLLSPLQVDSSVAGIYWTLACGGELLLTSDTGRRDATRIAELLREAMPSHLLCIPSLYKLVLEAVDSTRPPSLRAAIVAAERCPREIVAQHNEILPEVALFNEYGPSEATVWASVLSCRGYPYARISIGRPAPHTGLDVLTQSGRAAAVGETGEIHIRGALASGYWRDPRETARCFLPDASGGTRGARRYRTGDYGSWNADASLTFAGRRDEQVKVLGFRVELPEVAAAIASHPMVKEAHVGFLPESAELVAYVACEPEIAFGAHREQLAGHLRSRLPEFMHPRRWVHVPSLPRLPGGKIDAQRLPVPDTSTGAPPAIDDPLEALVASIWRRYLPAKAIGRDDNFFACGGNSLNGVQIVSSLRDALQTDAIGLPHLFEVPVLSGFASTLRQLLMAPDGPDEAGMTAHEAVFDATDPAVTSPASFFQERLYFLHLLDPDAGVYNCPFAIHVEGPIDPAAIQRCLRLLQERHPALRTRLRMAHSKLEQEVGVAEIDLQHVDLRASGTAPAAVDALVLAEGTRPFRLDGGTLFRAKLLLLDDRSSVLLVTVHHAVFDGWSLRVLIADFKRLYDAEIGAGDAAELEPAPAYGAFAAHQQRLWADGAWRDQLRYWLTELQGVAATPPVPTDRPRSEAQQFEGEVLHFEWPAALISRVRAVCQQGNMTEFMFFEALLALVLHRYGGQDDVLIGVPVANRRHPGAEQMIGPVANTLAIRNRFRTGLTWEALLAQVRATAVRAYCNQDVPFEKVVEALQPPRTLVAAPLFQVMLAVQNIAMEPFDLAGVRCEVLPHRSRTAKFDLTLSLFTEGDGTSGQLEYNTALFERGTALRVLETLEQALNAVLDHPDLPLHRLDLLAAAEKRLLSEWSPPSAARDDATLVSLFEAQAQSRPDAIAAVFGDASLSYSELDTRANRLARHLCAHGARPDRPVAVIAERSLELVVTLVAILKAGCSYLPLDGDAPRARLEKIWTRAGKPPAVTDRRRAQYSFLGAEEICLAEYDPVDQLEDLPLDLMVDPGQAAYLMYTSGSTGEPKGVTIPHRGIVNRLRWMGRELGLTTADTVLQKTPYTFDVSVWEFFWPLTSGARLVLAPPGRHADPRVIRALLQAEQVGYVHFVPSMLSFYLQMSGFEGLPALRAVVSSGEVLDAALCQRFLEQSENAQLHNMYGPTEASVDVSSWRCVSAEAPVPIGHPIDGVSLHVADAAQTLVPLGAVGELLIGGVGLARGYHADPRATARSFRPDDQHGGTGARLYRSGDLTRRRGDGALEFLGRSDDQVKVRGIRIELGEIERALWTVPGVVEVAVVVVGPDTPEARIVAYLTGVDTAALADARQHVAGLLPSAMLPADLVALEELPRLPSGKVDRASLLNRDCPVRPLVPYAPATETERSLAELWKEHLQVAEIQADAGFFAAGGHSLRAVAMLADLNRDFGINMTLRTFLDSLSFPDLAGRVDALRHLRDTRVDSWSSRRSAGEVEGSL